MVSETTDEQLKEWFESASDVEQHQFEILRQISRSISVEATFNTGREMLLRALEHRDRFVETQQVVNSLINSVGLYPFSDTDMLSLSDLLAYEYNRTLESDQNGAIFHREQADIYRRLVNGENVVLSAPTSFGKSRIIDAVIATNDYQNVVIIVPTLALIDETRRRLSSIE